MSLAKRYRTRFGAPRGDRLLFYLTTALAVHAGMATAGWVSWQERQTAAEAPAAESQPIEFIYLDEPESPDSPEIDANLLAQADAEAAGTRIKNLPVNAGKVITAAKSLEEGKPVEVAPQTGQIQPTSHTPTRPAPAATSPIAAETTVSPEAEEAKEVEPAPAPLPLDDSLVGSIPELPSLETENADGLAFSGAEAVGADEEGAIAASPDPSTRPQGTVVGDPLPPPPTIDDTTEEGEGGSDAVTNPVDTSEEESEDPDTPAPVDADSGLDGLPNPDQTVSDEAPQIAARREQELGEYVNALIAEIETVWSRIEVQNSYFPVVRFEISRDGTLQSVTLIEPSGSTDADQAAVDAVQAATPFEPFPEAVEDAALSIRLEFNYIVNPDEESQEESIPIPLSTPEQFPPDRRVTTSGNTETVR